jgi:hypothetical protein
MNHDQFLDLVHLSLYHDLDEDQQQVLALHLKSCAECSVELEQLKKLDVLLRTNQRFEVTDQLLDEARRELRVALRLERSKRSLVTEWVERLNVLRMPGVRLAMGGAATLVIGFCVGYLVFSSGRESQSAGMLPAVGQSVVDRNEPRVSGFRFVQQPQEGGDVEIAFDLVTPVRMKGNIADNAIQRVLAQALMNEHNPGARIRTVSALASQVDLSGKPDEEVKAALIQALKTDGNAGVRMEALKALEKFPLDKSIQNALLYILSHDTNPSMRIGVINYLEKPALAGESVDQDILNVLKERMQSDNNNYVRTRAKNFYEEAKQQ